MAIFVEDVLALLCLLALPRGPHLLVACGALLWSLCESRDSTGNRRGGDSWRDWGRLKNLVLQRIHVIYTWYNPPKMLIEKVSRFLKDDIICSNWWGLNSFQIWWNMSVHLSTQIVFATLLGPILACAYEDDAKVHAGDAASSVLWAFLGGAKNVVSSPYYREHCSGAILLPCLFGFIFLNDGNAHSSASGANKDFHCDMMSVPRRSRRGFHWSPCISVIWSNESNGKPYQTMNRLRSLKRAHTNCDIFVFINTSSCRWCILTLF